MLKQLLDTFW